MKRSVLAGLAFGAAALLAISASAQTITVPQVTSIGSTDLFQDIVGGQPNAQSRYAAAPLIGGLAFTQAGAGNDNALVGGDFATNLWQRGTSVGSITTSLLYTADRWAAWSGSATTLTVTQQTGSTDITQGTTASLRVNKGSGAGVVQACIAQPLETTSSTRFQGQTAEFDFNAKAGPNFSAASSNLQVSIVTGTGSDQSATSMAFAFNGGGGGSSTWTNQASTVSNLAVPISSGGFNRYSVFVAIPTTTTQIAVLICYTPVGTGVAGDWFEITNAQLVVNPSLTPYLVTGGAVLTNDVRAKAFVRRSAGLEASLQQRYSYSVAEAAAGVVQSTVGTAQGTTTTCTVGMPFPVLMRTAPTYTNVLGASTFKIVSASQTATALGSPFSATLVANTTTYGSINFTTTGMTAKDSCFLVGAGGTGLMLWSAEL